MPKPIRLAGKTFEASSTGSTSTAERLESLTFLRFIAAVVVVIFHYGSGTSIYASLPTILNCGPIMVTFFFVLSGFVLAISNTKKNISISQFYVNRIARILPIYLIALIAYVIISGNSFNGRFLISASLIQSWLPKYATSLNYPGWSVSVEIFFYAICPLLILMADSKKNISLKAWFASAVFFWFVSQVILSHFSRTNSGPGTATHSLINYFPPAHLCSFVLGFTAGLFFKSGFLRKVIGEKTSLVISVLLFAAIGKVIDYGPVIDNTTGVHAAYASSFTAILFTPAIYFCAIANNLLKKAALMPALVVLGESSYSLYILQEPAHLAFQMIPAQLTFESATINFSVFVILLIALSIASYFLIEKPCSKAIKEFYAKRIKPSSVHSKAVA
ncbi:acyltransferase family protein [Pseudomonas kairouanensis]|uniref:acyltransferase family protein n=1 Tax=Pseudomonas kairouanensis TaxID=2293832 RepID=UPI00142E9E14|nr:acyltransferase [Pseudomonas kairouanensis]